MVDTKVISTPMMVKNGAIKIIDGLEASRTGIELKYDRYSAVKESEPHSHPQFLFLHILFIQQN